MSVGPVKEFVTTAEHGVAAAFEQQGYVIVPVENRPGLDAIGALVAQAAAQHLGLGAVNDPVGFLDSIHALPALKDGTGGVSAGALNGLRLAVINVLRGADWFRPTYCSLVRNSLHEIVGNELAMQRGIGLSVQLPRDDSSLLPIHADVWDGDSPFEVVVWLPLVDCFATKSMYIVPIAQDRPIQATMSDGAYDSSEALYQGVKDVARFLTIGYGSVLLFSQTLMHGNRINIEATTRWSMNCRFKSILSPFSDKRLGEFFEPISMKAATRLGLAYKMPGAFK